GVIGMLGFALRDSRLHQGTREQILRGQANAQSLLLIINGLLDFSKIEAGKVTIEHIDFALAATLDNVVSLFEDQAVAHSVDFDVNLAPDLPRFVVGDPARLRQVLVNLVGNAFKFTNRGAVTVHIERLAPGVLPPHIHQVRFAVHDSGIGIAPEALARLFHAFEQADSSTARRYGGTGLGLTICRQLVELMGGRIGAVSEPGVGSCFSFVVPLADGVAPALAPPAPRAPHSHRLKVLCAEDYPTNQIIIRMMLEELGHEVDIADNGQKALAACARSRYDLILMDGRMPELDGASATRLIRAGGPAEAPVRDCAMMIIALTANASEEDRARYLACGMDDFLSKPIDEAALHAQLSRAIAHQLARGMVLAPMAAQVAQLSQLPQMPQLPQVPGGAELDALFGVPAEPGLAKLAELAAVAGLTGLTPNAGRRSSDLKARMHSAFASDLPARRAQLEAAVAGEQGDMAALLLHGIRGSTAYLEATELHALCGELEVAADQGEWGAIGAGMERLRHLLAGFEVAGPWCRPCRRDTRHCAARPTGARDDGAGHRRRHRLAHGADAPARSVWHG
ncbi:MAG: response regulator, partial [Massilia sp.]|nr:response regulator [Massilia sp.]